MREGLRGQQGPGSVHWLSVLPALLPSAPRSLSPQLLPLPFTEHRYWEPVLLCLGLGGKWSWRQLAPGCHSDRGGGTGCVPNHYRAAAAEREVLVSGSRWGEPGELSWRKAGAQLRPEGRRVKVKRERPLCREERICSCPDVSGAGLRAAAGRIGWKGTDLHGGYQVSYGETRRIGGCEQLGKGGDTAWLPFSRVPWWEDW